jgi:hypothetical protein
VDTFASLHRTAQYQPIITRSEGPQVPIVIGRHGSAMSVSANVVTNTSTKHQVIHSYQIIMFIHMILFSYLPIALPN